MFASRPSRHSGHHFGRLCPIGHNQIIYGEFAVKELMHFIWGCRVWGNMWESSLSLSLSLFPPVLLIEVIAVTPPQGEPREAGHWLDFHGKADSGHSGSDRSSIDSPFFTQGEGSMPPSLYPRFAEEKQESAGETKTSMGTVAPVSPCLWLLLLLGGLCLPFWTQVLLPPSLTHRPTPPPLSHPFFSSCQVAAEVLPFHSLTPDTPPFRSPHRLWVQRLFVIFICWSGLVTRVCPGPQWDSLCVL